ncbi:MAG: hypothetical protein WBY88_16470 [Desulfosarcina sp.]
MIGKPRIWPRLLGFGIAFFFLSGLLNFNYPANPLFTWRLLLPSLDVWLLMMIMAVAAGCGKRWLFWTGLAVWVLFLFLKMFRIGDTLVPMYLNRPFNLYIDSRYLLGLFDLLETSSLNGSFLMPAALTTALGVIAASGVAWLMAARALRIYRLRLVLLCGSLLILCIVWLAGWKPVETPAMLRLGQEIIAVRQHVRRQRAFVARLEQVTLDRTAQPASLNGLGRADVLLFMVESYGRIVFSRPDYRQSMAATMDGFAKILDRHGFDAVSNYLVSPTYGGSSWLAHSTLESGIRVGDDFEYAALLRSSLPPMAAFFNRQGYRSVSVMPGTRFAYPEGAYFSYQRAAYAWHFDYRGRSFGWAPMPDQFVLDWVRRQEFERRQQPLFVRFALISSHGAYNLQPPFISDWNTIGDGSIYNRLAPIYYPYHWTDIKHAGDAYLRSLDYVFRALGDYLARYVTADALIIVMGDHQPTVQLTGPGKPWSVPVHIISRNRRLLEPFHERGYTPGLTPHQPPPHAGMETFLPGLLEDFR